MGAFYGQYDIREYDKYFDAIKYQSAKLHVKMVLKCDAIFTMKSFSYSMCFFSIDTELYKH